MASLLLVLVAAAFIVLTALGIGVVVLIKMGVITKYALTEEPHDEEDYELDQSHEVKD